MRRKPPTLRSLLAEPLFRQYMKTRPKLPEVMTNGKPWRIWIRTTRNTWLTGEYVTYDEVWQKTLEVLKNPTYEDVSIVSKRVLFAPPTRMPLQNLLTIDNGHWEWCARCRRPSVFLYSDASHHALRKLVAVNLDEPYRCYFCGIRRAGQPVHTHRRHV